MLEPYLARRGFTPPSPGVNGRVGGGGGGLKKRLRIIYYYLRGIKGYSDQIIRYYYIINFLLLNKYYIYRYINIYI